MNFAALHALPIKRETGTWYRAVQPQHFSTSLKTSHTKVISSRFNQGTASSPQFSMLYLAENPVVALFEAQAVFGSTASPTGIIAHPLRSFVIINVHVQLDEIVDLSDPANQSLIDTTAQEMTGDWSGYHARSTMTSVSGPLAPAPTQRLGAQLSSRTTLEGFLTVSAKQPLYRNLIVFPQNLGPTSSLVFYNPSTGTKSRIDQMNPDGT